MGKLFWISHVDESLESENLFQMWTENKMWQRKKGQREATLLALQMMEKQRARECRQLFGEGKEPGFPLEPPKRNRDLLTH